MFIPAVVPIRTRDKRRMSIPKQCRMSWAVSQRLDCASKTRCVARNSQWGGGCFGGLGAEIPAAGGWGFRGQSPQLPEARGSGGEAPSARKFCIFLQK